MRESKVYKAIQAIDNIVREAGDPHLTADVTKHTLALRMALIDYAEMVPFVDVPLIGEVG